MSDTAFTLPSFAKINWVLRVIGRRTDGFHELSTVFQTITLHDQLTFEARKDGKLVLSCSAPGIPVDRGNLIYRAAESLRARHGLDKGARVHLEKRIPAGGGLGGGSSNAAVALLGLARVWEIETTRRELNEIGARLGADVPFFFFGGTALGTGLGTDVFPLPDTTVERLLVVAPRVKVLTADAYRALNAPALTKVESDIILAISRAAGRFPNPFHEVLRNDFEPVVFRLEPEIERVKNALLEVGACRALMAGSGSSVFGIFDNGEARERAMSALKARHHEWLVFACATLGREGYMMALGRCADPLRNALPADKSDDGA